MALGWSEFLQELLATNRLVAPFSERLQIPKPWGYYILTEPKDHSDHRSEHIDQVKQWILKEAQ